MNNGEHANKILDFVLSLFGAIIVSLVLGSYFFTWLADNYQTQEKIKWRERHEQEHRESIKEIKEELRANQQEMKNLLEKIIRLQEHSKAGKG